MMAEFRFDFDVEDNNLEPQHALENSIETNAEKMLSSTQEEDSPIKAQELFVDLPAVEDKINPDDIDVILVGDVEIIYINSTGIEAEVKIEQSEQQPKDKKTDNFASAVSDHVDLISCVYEGGLKVWECCLDLANFLAQEKKTSWSNFDVLELGCGAGIPGLYLMVEGAAVHFQDYNIEVLERLTVPNVIMNMQRDEDDGKKKGCSCRYFAGDWSDMTSVLMTNDIQNKYDVILTSETIYNVKYYDRLHRLLAASLKPSGCVYVAAKTHYFGVGGGTRIFEDFINKNGVFNINTCWQNKEGLQREILKLEFKHSMET